MEKLTRIIIITKHVVMVCLANTDTGEVHMHIFDNEVLPSLVKMSNAMYELPVGTSGAYDLCSSRRIDDGTIWVDRLHLQFKHRYGSPEEREKLDDKAYICHHKDGCHYNSTLSNLEVLDRSQHALEHARRRREGIEPASLADALRNVTGRSKAEVQVCLSNRDLLVAHFIEHDGAVIEVSDDIWTKLTTENTCGDLVVKRIK